MCQPYYRLLINSHNIESKYLNVYLKITDNPAYFYTSDSPKTPEQTSKKFTFFRRRSSSNHKLISTKSGNYTQTETTANKNSNKNKLFDSDSEVTIRNQSELCGADNENFIYGKFRQRLGSCNDSVFYSDKSECIKPLNRSYNSKTNSISSDGRRHSIGTFLLKDRLRSGSFSDEVPKIHAPKVPSVRVQHYKYGRSFNTVSMYYFHIRHNLNNLFKLKTTFKLLTSSLSLKILLMVTIKLRFSIKLINCCTQRKTFVKFTNLIVLVKY